MRHLCAAGCLKTPYATKFLRSKLYFHVKGFGVNTTQIGDAMYYSCIPMILADQYDLLFGDILNWKSFSVVETGGIPPMKKILKVFDKVGRHFQWHREPIDFDAFRMVMYELWLRRSYVRVPLS
ncbi:hypothetical protein Vadar_024005 [Vaccinium darrowii]|uniref:Uncharacterized protein n=1 Tax=Vaccinium darrowii TaxID=229202 RepID=A0ACB7YP17_9ERIC|nr:hypothetical protein Vadar_024005 [Vaccinium darrowii]